MSELKVKIGDITKLDADCIVNAANKSLLGGGGVDGAIHRAAGKELLEECRTLNGCETGEAKITKGYRLPAKYVIHTVGPRYRGRESDYALLASCYRNSLDLAKENGIRSIAFPSISAGAYGFDIRNTAPVAVNACRQWLNANPDYDIEITFCAFSASDGELYSKELGCV